MPGPIDAIIKSGESRANPEKVPGIYTPRAKAPGATFLTPQRPVAQPVPIDDEEEITSSTPWYKKAVFAPFKALRYGISKGLGVLNFMSDTDAAFVEYLHNQYRSLTTGVDFGLITQKKDDESTWQALIRQHKERPGWKMKLAEEILLSPWNATMFINPFARISQLLAKSNARIVTKMILGESNLFLKGAKIPVLGLPLKAVLPTKTALKVRATEKVEDGLNILMTAHNPETGLHAVDANDFLGRLQGFIEGRTNWTKGAWTQQQLSKKQMLWEASKGTVHNPFRPNNSQYLHDIDEIRSYLAKGAGYKKDIITGRWMPTSDTHKMMFDAQLLKKSNIDVVQELTHNIVDNLGLATPRPNAFYRMGETQRRFLRPLWLFLRPAYTVNNQVSNAMMMSLNNPATGPVAIVKWITNPAFRKHLTQTVGETKAKYILEGMGIPREIFGGKVKQAVVTIEDVVNPRVLKVGEEAPQVLSFFEKPWGLRQAADLSRAVNFKGERLAKAIDYTLTYDKNYKYLMTKHLKAFGLPEDDVKQLLNLTPDEFTALFKGDKIPSKTFLRLEGLSPTKVQEIQERLIKAPDTIEDTLKVLGDAKTDYVKDWQEFRTWMAVQFGGDEDAAKVMIEKATASFEELAKSAETKLDVGRYNQLRDTLIEEVRRIDPKQAAFLTKVEGREARKVTAFDTIRKYEDRWMTGQIGSKPEIIDMFYNQARLIQTKARLLRLQNMSNAYIREIKPLAAKGEFDKAREVIRRFGRENDAIEETTAKAIENLGKAIDTKYAHLIKPGVSPEELARIKKELPLLGWDKRLGDDVVSEILDRVGIGYADPNKGAETLSYIDELMKREFAKFDDAIGATNKAYGNYLAGNTPKNIKIPLKAYTEIHNQSRTVAGREALRRTELDLFNYGNQTNFDYGMRHLFPYPFWATRFTMHWAQRALENPAQLNIIATIMKQWNEESENKPPHLRFSPMSITLGSTEFNFSPLSFMFPLGYPLLDFIKYGTEGDDIVETIANMQDAIGGYFFPMYETAMGATGLGYRTRGAGLTREPLEVIKDMIPQQRIIGSGIGAMGMDFALNHPNLVPQQVKDRTIFAIGDAANAGEISKDDAQSAIKSIENNNADAIAKRYFTKVNRNMFATNFMRYTAPISVTPPNSKVTFAARQAYYGTDPTKEAVSPEIQAQILAKYPGLEVTRGKVIPAGLSKDELKQWQAAQKYYEGIDRLQEERDTLRKQLEVRFNNPKGGLSPTAYQKEVRRINDRYSGGMDALRAEAELNDAPLSSEERTSFWMRVGRKTWARHPYKEALDNYYKIEADSFKSIEGETDWERFFNIREQYLDSLDSGARQWVESQINKPDAPDRDFRVAMKQLREYFALRDNLLANSKESVKEAVEISEIYRKMEQLGQIKHKQALVFINNPLAKRFEKTVDSVKRQWRMEHPESDKSMSRYFGTVRIKEQVR